ncbi:superoxide dismutase family protein [Pedomonas mirosovicensis]|uniref:superoxide dismutase family protein n=1 Tax=Pedomonas mirosovicensis TaxID=2908641 RepID=UPI00216AA301|nr:superoxide dismutase family protein [Pedomonas mirosovicensis]MCH8686098.1 superoxide dismutase family protein [Pedomonas mirosovicensis]
MHTRTIASLALVAAVLGSASAMAKGETATADLRNREGAVVGHAELTQQGEDVVVKGTVKGLPAGVHAFHIHQTGKCEPPFTSAGGHYNPHHKAHGHENPQGSHVGDLMNVEVKSEGAETAFEQTVKAVRLQADQGPAILDADGAAVVFHAKADDYKSDPAGNAGDRLVCGVVEMK